MIFSFGTMIIDECDSCRPNYRQQFPPCQNVAHGKDIISYLPESILSHILSHLPTKDAVRTSVLSIDWEFKWTLVYNLNFKDEVGLEEVIDLRRRPPRRVHFMNFVDRVIFVSSTSTLKSFELLLGVHYGFYDPPRVKSWIANVLRRNVQNLHLVNIPDESVFPCYFFICGSLRHLKLKRCSLKAPSHTICLSNLRFLNLTEVKINTRKDDFSTPRKLVLAFPALEVLEIRICKWRDVKILKIDAPRLVSFSMIYPTYECSIDRSNDCRIEMCQAIANLASFRCVGLLLEHFVFAGPLIADNVELRYEIELENNPHWRRMMGSRACALLRGFSAVTRCLEISHDFLVILAGVDPPSPLPVLDGLTHLKISSISDTGQDAKCNMALVNLLKIVPALELLTFTLWGSNYNDDEFETVDLLPPNFLSCLKVIRFQHFLAREDEMELLKFLLNRALLLDVLIIGCETESFGANKVEIMDRVRRLPRGSAHASIVFSLNRV